MGSTALSRRSTPARELSIGSFGSVTQLACAGGNRSRSRLGGDGTDKSVPVRIDLVTGAEIARIPLQDRADELHSGAHFTGVAADGDAA